MAMKIVMPCERNSESRRQNSRAGERELLLHAARQPLRQARAERCELHHVEQPVPASAVLGHAVNLGEEGDVLVDRQVAVEAEPLREVAHPGGDGVMLPDRVVAEYAEGAAVRPEQAAEQPDRRRLAGAVRADEAEHLAAVHRVRHARHRLGGPEALGDAVQLECRCGHLLAWLPDRLAPSA
ncbi:MAG: hypothetical protein MUF60_11485 [Vicinamibacterales bacterium]|nr:hypothetical protein [Vicinamibacterales bacterium]